MNDFGFIKYLFNSEYGNMTHQDFPDIFFHKSSIEKSDIDSHCKDVKIIIDIGAFDGGDTLRFCKWYPNATIFTIEANKNNFDMLNKKLKALNNLKAYNYAVSNTNGVKKY